MKKKILSLLFLLAICVSSALAQRTVTGIVSDDSGEPLPGVTVVIKGTSQGSVTDQSGHFSIDILDENSVLIFSFIGMETKEMVVGSQTAINITLATASIEMV